MGMPPDMAAWAQAELKKLGGGEDITLLDFCMSSTDASEVREVLAAYLGSTPQVSSFATNFLQRKQAAKRGGGGGGSSGGGGGGSSRSGGSAAPKQEGWAQASAKKKGSGKAKK
ncbi:hypothetical protein JKP88DRAFT_229772 [Tribonema minus]|uniref:Uncharacterized protein n=1 Tax=Tribonema minus TaxID=303371 RepID=A0A835ZDV0_9STRA|nr:hypothetical protein JKP88DRAFT_229772 [Tribonema minus]